MIENFKGIEFVRISSLPQSQKDQIWKSFRQDKIIKIVKGDSVLTDCILVQDFESWVEQLPKDLDTVEQLMIKPSQPNNPFQNIFSKLALK